MKHSLFLLLLSLLLLTSCASSFQISGTSDVVTLDGQRLFLKVVKQQAPHNVDSCDVVHGKFTFAGTVDSAAMATISTEQENMMPVVIESGDIKVQISARGAAQASGTPMNDKLYDFLSRYDQLQMQSMELIRKHDQAIMDGNDMNVVEQQISQEYLLINQRLDSLITTFISDNFNNVLGPGVFMMMTSSYDYPVFTPWIDDLISKATTYFKNDPYVKAYIHDAQRIQNIQNGMEELPQQPSASATTPPQPAATTEQQAEAIGQQTIPGTPLQ